MSEDMQERTQRNIEEFSRIQKYLSLADNDSVLYKEMLERYYELKAALEVDGINMTTLDRLKL